LLDLFGINTCDILESSLSKKAGKKVYHLNIGQPDINTPELALEAIHNFPDKVVEYSHSAGFESYRKGLANYYQNLGIAINKDEVIVTTGGSEALLFALNSCLDNGDEVIIPEPFYANYNGFATSAGVTVKPIATSIHDGFALPEIAEFEKLITAKTKAILICNPGNPTGYLYSKEELETLRDIVIKHDLFLIADEVYREFAYDGHVHHSVLNIEGLEQHAIVIDSTSKRYSMCGIRVGCIVSKDKELMGTAMKFAQARLSPPTFGQIAGEARIYTVRVGKNNSNNCVAEMLIHLCAY
jgi:aspartate aminotransferase